MGFEPKPLAETNIKAEIVKEGKQEVLVIRAPIQTPKRSGGGEGSNMIVASTSGNRKTELKVNGQKIIIGLNAYYPAD